MDGWKGFGWMDGQGLVGTDGTDDLSCIYIGKHVSSS